MNGVILAACVIGVLGLLIALLLGFAAIKLAVPVDEKEIAVREYLPGNNCGGCGYAGCDALAKAIAAGEAPVNACPVGGAAVAEKIGAVMGVEGGDAVKMVAFVKCAGTCEKAGIKANYYGVSDCKSAAAIPGRGDKACAYGCLGFGSCVAACQFDALHIKEGVAFVDKEKCVACGKCIQECPNGLIELVPYDAKYAVSCSNKDKGPKVIDTVSGKLGLAEQAYASGTPIISAMGAGNKLDPTAFEVADIMQTSVCPLARVMRRELKKRGIPRLKVVYSKELPAVLQRLEKTEQGKPVPGSCAFVPSVAGLILAGEVIKDLTGLQAHF